MKKVWRYCHRTRTPGHAPDAASVMRVSLEPAGTAGEINLRYDLSLRIPVLLPFLQPISVAAWLLTILDSPPGEAYTLSQALKGIYMPTAKKQVLEMVKK